MIHNKKVQVFLGVLLLVVVLAAMYFGLHALDRRDTGNTDDEEDDYAYVSGDNEIIFDGKIYKLGHNVKNYLIMGTDASGNEDDKGEAYQGSMADFLMLMMIDETDKKYGFMPLNRDTVTDIQMIDHNGDLMDYRKLYLCTAHWYGGSKRQSCINTADAVSDFLHGVPVNGYLAIPMDHISDLNHVLGGVTVTLEDDFSKEDPAMTAGTTLTLTDEQAAIFLRGRMEVGDGENTSRMRRQKAYLQAAISQIQLQSSEDAKFMAKAYQQIMEYATSDMNMNAITKLGQHLDEYESLGFVEIAGETKLGYDRLEDGKEHAEFFADEQSLKDAVFKLFPLKDTGEREEDASDESTDSSDSE